MLPKPKVLMDCGGQGRAIIILFPYTIIKWTLPGVRHIRLHTVATVFPILLVFKVVNLLSPVNWNCSLPLQFLQWYLHFLFKALVLHQTLNPRRLLIPLQSWWCQQFEETLHENLLVKGSHTNDCFPSIFAIAPHKNKVPW